MAGLNLSESQLREVQRVALAVPAHLRASFLARVRHELNGRQIGDGMVWRCARDIAKTLSWNRPSSLS